MLSKRIVLVANDTGILDKIIWEMSAKYEIMGILSETLSDSYQGIPVIAMYKMNELIQQDILLVLSDNINMLVFTRMCLNNRLKLFEQFVPYWLATECIIDPLIVFDYVGKDKKRFSEAMLNLKSHGKIIAIYGNCQTQVLKYYLSKIKTIQEEYFIFSFPEMWNLKHKGRFEELFFCEALYYVDVLFIQNISENNRFGKMFSTAAVQQCLNQNCKIIKLCNVYCNGYYPQFDRPDDYKEILEKVVINKEALGLFKNFLDWNVCRMVAEGKNIDEIVETITGEDFYDKIYINKRFWNEMEAYEKRETGVDIRIADFIEKNINKVRLFEANRHPTESVFIEILQRMLQKLGIEEEVYFADVAHPRGLSGGDEQVIVYPSVFRCFGIDKTYANILYKMPISKKEVSFYEYMKTYIKLIFPECK